MGGTSHPPKLSRQLPNSGNTTLEVVNDYPQLAEVQAERCWCLATCVVGNSPPKRIEFNNTGRVSVVRGLFACCQDSKWSDVVHVHVLHRLSFGSLETIRSSSCPGSSPGLSVGSFFGCCTRHLFGPSTTLGSQRISHLLSRNQRQWRIRVARLQSRTF